MLFLFPVFLLKQLSFNLRWLIYVNLELNAQFFLFIKWLISLMRKKNEGGGGDNLIDHK